MNEPFAAAAICSAIGVVLCVSAALPAAEAGSPGRLNILAEKVEILPVPMSVYSSVKRSAAGDVVLRTSDHWGIHRLVGAGRQLQTFTMHKVPEAGSANVELSNDFAVDPGGSIYAGGIWRSWKGAAVTAAGVFVFDASGRYVRTIRLQSLMRPERIAVDSAGNVLVLAIDPSYFKRKSEQCLLIHKFSPSGERIKSFSNCPEGLQLRREGADVRPGPDLSRLRGEVEPGILWTEAKHVFHVLPVSRVLRRFNEDGVLIAATALEPPEADEQLRQSGMAGKTARDRIWRVVPVSGDRWLVEWMHVAPQAPGQKRFRYLSLHDAAGRPLTTGMPAPWSPSFPAFSDTDGRCYFMRISPPDRVEMVRVTVGVR